MNRYAATARDDDEAPARLTARERLDAQNAEQWTRWSAGVNERLAGLDAFCAEIMGGEDKNKEPGALLGLYRMSIEEMRAEVAASVKEMSDALNARIEAEVAVLHDGFVDKIDASIVASAPKKLRAISDDIARVRTALREQSDETSALLDKAAERIDAVDAKRRYDRNTWHKEKTETAAKVVAVVGDMLDRVNARLDRQEAAIKTIEEALREEFASPPSRRLLAP
jgi:hypothetical protein